MGDENFERDFSDDWKDWKEKYVVAEKTVFEVSHPSFHRSHQFDTEEDAKWFVEHDWKRLKKFFDSWNKEDKP